MIWYQFIMHPYNSANSCEHISSQISSCTLQTGTIIMPESVRIRWIQVSWICDLFICCSLADMASRQRHLDSFSAAATILLTAACQSAHPSPTSGCEDPQCQSGFFIFSNIGFTESLFLSQSLIKSVYLRWVLWWLTAAVPLLETYTTKKVQQGNWMEYISEWIKISYEEK